METNGVAISQFNVNFILPTKLFSNILLLDDTKTLRTQKVQQTYKIMIMIILTAALNRDTI